MKQSHSLFDVIVVGGGHAGIEASLVCAKLGLSVKGWWSADEVGTDKDPSGSKLGFQK